jgi:signal-transduction protein with cAMP-binding, CBS, and nucleotidyltransferase domain
MSDSRIIPVKEIMQTHFASIDGTATISEAIQEMKKANTSVLIVNKRHADDEHGMLTAHDIARQVLAKNRAPDRVNVYEVMICPVIQVRPEMDIRFCSRLLAAQELTRVLVSDSNNVVGIVNLDTLVLDGLYKLI